VRPWLKRGADLRERPLPAAAFLDGGTAQWRSLPSRLARRRQLAQILGSGLPQGLLLASEDPAVSAEYAQIAVVADRATALAQLSGVRIDALPAPMIVRGVPAEIPVAAFLGEHAVQLPWFDGITDDEVAHVLRAVREVRS
jgi:dTDP-4-amino-4,6-dideoxygalactose transaminase